MTRKIKSKIMNVLKDEKAIGYVESLIAIAVSGILMVAVGLLMTRVIRATTRNELTDMVNEEVQLYAEISRGIRDNGWNTEDFRPPVLGEYDYCFTEADGYYFCDPNLEADNLLNIDDTFARDINLTVDEDRNTATVEISLSCNSGECENISLDETVILNISSN